jgi:thiol-disulfide isomerase/thioredoxin
MIGQVLPLVVVVALVGIVSLWYRRTNGAVTSTTATFTPAALRELGAAHSGRTILVFTAPGCAPCGPAKGIADEVAKRHDVAVVVADVTEHHAIAAAQHVYRAPTTFVVDDRGHALTRISGVPRVEELDAVLAGARAFAA